MTQEELKEQIAFCTELSQVWKPREGQHWIWGPHEKTWVLGKTRPGGQTSSIEVWLIYRDTNRWEAEDALTRLKGRSGTWSGALIYLAQQLLEHHQNESAYYDEMLSKWHDEMR